MKTLNLRLVLFAITRMSLSEVYLFDTNVTSHINLIAFEIK